MTSETKEIEGLALLRKPFEEHQISQLPKPTKSQTDAVKADYRKGIRCKICGGWHHPDVIHVEYVGHAALTNRLLDCDPKWSWEPVAVEEDGTPKLDRHGGMWIRLTICGISRLGYGHPDGRTGGDAIKEVIGDALRNAAMRFGAALDLWHKGDLHLTDASDGERGLAPEPITSKQAIELEQRIADLGANKQALLEYYKVDGLHQLTPKQLSSAHKSLDRRAAQAGQQEAA